MHNTNDYLSAGVDGPYDTASCSNTIPFDYNFLDTNAQNNIDSLYQQSGCPLQLLYSHLAYPMPHSLGGITPDENSYQSLHHEEPDQSAMKRLIDALCLKEGSCDCDTIKIQPPEDWPAPSDADDQFNPISMEATDQAILLELETNPRYSNDHEEAIANLGKHITSLQYGSTVYRVINDNDPGRSRFRNVKPQCGECRLEFGRRNCFVRHIINRQNRWSSIGYRLISSYRSLQPADFAAFTAGDSSNYWCRDFKELEQKWRSLMKECECADLDTIKIVDYQTLKCYLIKMIEIMTKSNNGGGQSCYSKKSLLYRVGDESHHLRIEFTNK